MIWIRPLSCLLSPIHMTEMARVNDARAFFRVSSNLGLARPRTLKKFSRYIRFGVLSVSDAEGIILNRLPVDKMRKYQLIKYLISYGWINEESFYFNPSQVWHDIPEKVESITLFP